MASNVKLPKKPNGSTPLVLKSSSSGGKNKTERMKMYLEVKRDLSSKECTKYRSTSKELREIIFLMINDLEKQKSVDNDKMGEIESENEELKKKVKAMQNTTIDNLEESAKHIVEEKDREIEMLREIVHEKSEGEKKLNYDLDKEREIREQVQLEIVKLRSEIEFLKDARDKAMQNKEIQFIDQIKNQINDSIQLSSMIESNKDEYPLINYSDAVKFNKPYSQQKKPENESRNRMKKVNLDKKSTIVIVEREVASTKSPNEVFREVTKQLNPLDSKIKFEEVTLNKSSKIIVRFKDVEEDEASVINALKKIDKVDVYKLRSNRQVQVKSVPKYVDEEQFKEELENNFKINGTIKIKMLSNERFKSNKFIVTLNEEDARELIKLEKLRIGFKQCPVEPNIRPMQCLNCGQYGHAAYKDKILVCNNKPNCFTCNGEHITADHEKNVTNEINQDVIKCNNCQSNDHKTFSVKCRIYEKVLNNLIKKW